MIDYYGQWTYEPDTPKEKKCDCDRIADWIKEKDYKPKYVIDGGFICREQSANDEAEELAEDIKFIDCEDSEVEDENQ